MREEKSRNHSFLLVAFVVMVCDLVAREGVGVLVCCTVGVALLGAPKTHAVEIGSGLV